MSHLSVVAGAGYAQGWAVRDGWFRRHVQERRAPHRRNWPRIQGYEPPPTPPSPPVSPPTSTHQSGGVLTDWCARLCSTSPRNQRAGAERSGKGGCLLLFGCSHAGHLVDWSNWASGRRGGADSSGLCLADSDDSSGVGHAPQRALPLQESLKEHAFPFIYR